MSTLRSWGCLERVDDFSGSLLKEKSSWMLESWYDARLEAWTVYISKDEESQRKHCDDPAVLLCLFVFARAFNSVIGACRIRLSSSPRLLCLSTTTSSSTVEKKGRCDLVQTVRWKLEESDVVRLGGGSRVAGIELKERVGCMLRQLGEAVNI